MRNSNIVLSGMLKLATYSRNILKDISLSRSNESQKPHGRLARFSQLLVTPKGPKNPLNSSVTYGKPSGKVQPKNKVSQVDEINFDEYAEAMILWIHYSQIKNYADEIETLKSKEKLSNVSKLRQYEIYLDKAGLIRIGGRLQYMPNTFIEKDQIYLDKMRGSRTSLL